MSLGLSRHLEPHFFVRRFPISDRPRFGPEQALRYAELLRELERPSADPAARVRLLSERALIEELGRRRSQAQATLAEAVELARAVSPELLCELRYEQAKLRYRLSDLSAAASELQTIADELPGTLLARRAQLVLGRVFLDQGLFGSAVRALEAGLRGDNTRSNLLSGHLDLAYAHLRESDAERAAAAIRTAEAQIQPGDHAVGAAVLYYDGWLQFGRGQLAAARASLERAREKCRDLSLADAPACCELSLAFLEFRCGRLAECLAGCERAAALTGPDSRPDFVIGPLLLRSRASMVRGHYAAAIEGYQRAGERSQALGRPNLECRALEGLAAVHALVGEVGPARAALTRSLELRRTISDRLGECGDLLGLSAVERAAGSFDRAWAALEEARTVALQLGSETKRARVEGEAAEIAMATGDLPAAARHAAEASALYQRLGSRPRLAILRCTEARILALQDRFEEALQAADDAAAVVADDPCRVFLAEALAARAWVLDDRGDAEAATRTLARASELAAQSGAEALIEELRSSAEEVREREFGRRLLERYLDPRVVARLLARKERRLAESLLQQVTILFSDIRDYTTVSEKLSPQEVVLLLNEHFDAMGEEVTRLGGVIDKFMGDAIMVLFGDPGRPRPDDAARAVQAAVAMVRRRDAMNVERLKLGLPAIRIGVGIHSGPAVLGHIGSRHRVSYTVIGDAVNVASRLEGATKQHGRAILVSEDVARATGQHCPVSEVGELALKGRQATVRVFAVDGVEASR
jgi:class 3 adenylate cyclase